MSGNTGYGKGYNTASKIILLGAGSSVFARDVPGDCMIHSELEDMIFSLYDIDEQRLEDSYLTLNSMKHHSGENVTLEKYVGETMLPNAPVGFDSVIYAAQVGGYDPCTISDFEIPKKYGLRQMIADTLGVGGVLRALKTIPVLKTFEEHMGKYCPNAVFLNYTNPMGMLSGYMQRYSNMNFIGLYHSVQVAVPELFDGIGMEYDDKVQWKIAGINHMAWLLEASRGGVDLYPEVKRRSKELGYPGGDKVRHEIMYRFGYYVAESSEYNAEYMSYFIEDKYPELIQRYNIPLDEYPRRCIRHIEEWQKTREELTNSPNLGHETSKEYAVQIVHSIVNNKPFKFGGNVINHGVIPDLPAETCVEAPCISDVSGIAPVYVEELPEQLVALNRTNINVQLTIIETARTKKKEAVYQAVMLDPHVAVELSIDDIIAMCDDLFEAHKDWMPQYR